MIVYGYAKAHKYTGDGALLIQVRIPSIHGPYLKSDAKGQSIKNYVADQDLPYYNSLVLPYIPNEGEVVALINTGAGNSILLVIGVTGGSYSAGLTNLGE